MSIVLLTWGNLENSHDAQKLLRFSKINVYLPPQREQRTENPCVDGSIPPRTTSRNKPRLRRGLFFSFKSIECPALLPNQGGEIDSNLGSNPLLCSFTHWLNASTPNSISFFNCGVKTRAGNAEIPTAAAVPTSIPTPPLSVL